MKLDLWPWFRNSDPCPNSFFGLGPPHPHRQSLNFFIVFFMIASGFITQESRVTEGPMTHSLGQGLNRIEARTA
jgi:hypothetical protein